MSKPKINFGNNYRLLDKLGSGSFGEVYLLYDKVDGERYACKTELKSDKSRLKGEYNIYKRFAARNIKCIPTIYKYYETTDYNMLVMQLLGKSLDTIFEDCKKKLDIGTVMKVGIMIISHLEELHRAGFIHRDIKPNNFMFGLHDNANKLYVMDFGLSKKWYVKGDHIQYRTGRSMVGTARYASTNVHLGAESSRRDDMESVGYMLIYLVKGSLPWQGLKKKTKGDKTDHIGDKKMMVDLKFLCSGLPSCFYEYINYTKNLRFNDKPNYEYLRELFFNSANAQNIKLKYFWEKSDGIISGPNNRKGSSDGVGVNNGNNGGNNGNNNGGNNGNNNGGISGIGKVINNVQAKRRKEKEESIKTPNKKNIKSQTNKPSAKSKHVKSFTKPIPKSDPKRVNKNNNKTFNRKTKKIEETNSDDKASDKSSDKSSDNSSDNSNGSTSSKESNLSTREERYKQNNKKRYDNLQKNKVKNIKRTITRRTKKDDTENDDD
jgi:serine/threonine protein kinase